MLAATACWTPRRLGGHVQRKRSGVLVRRPRLRRDGARHRERSREIICK